jgi:hypothetical protein
MSSTFSIADTLTKKTIAIGEDKYNTIAIECNDNKKIDFLLNEYSDLHSNKDNGWHATIIRKLGADRYERLARMARADGRFPAKYMTWLINKELSCQ